MPEVGLERDSRPCKRWEVAETYLVRLDPTDVRPSPMAQVCTLCTPLLCRGLNGAPAPIGAGNTGTQHAGTLLHIRTHRASTPPCYPVMLPPFSLHLRPSTA